ncbi:MAG: plasmid pRiA4b ORF-3 family protein [Proteobacteria bacterium]|nr:plasmid pRiA4b ORF-3 family protein [Pseudomonadota bacterium]
MSERMYLLKVKLLDIEPEIWRRFVVPASITLDRLHDVIQVVMGWTDSHLHEFTIGKRRYTEYPQEREDGLGCGKYRFGDLVKQKNRKILYLYYFGDSWMHELVLEESHYLNPGLENEIACLDGARACPPEDVGGIPGYFDFCSVLADPGSEDYERLMEWSGGHYDSEEFDTDMVNWELMKYLRWSRDRYKDWGWNQ